ncbi:MAG: hypothetical protein M0C28_34545 [Candidatus Moduliflexus flocculans]|nr:hypothetical protein [Candidatus Moduliflexus flocculans]
MAVQTTPTIGGDPTGGANQVAKVVKSAYRRAVGWHDSHRKRHAWLRQQGSFHRVSNEDDGAGLLARRRHPGAAEGRGRTPTRSKSVETEATTTVANAWETLTFDFANPAAGTPALNLANTYNKASIFFNFGVTGATAGAKTYYFDDVAFGGGTAPARGGTWSPITFDDAAVTYTLTGFGGAEDSTVVADPTNAANKVARVVKSATAELWAGTTVSTGPNFSVADDAVHRPAARR